MAKREPHAMSARTTDERTLGSRQAGRHPQSYTFV